MGTQFWYFYDIAVTVIMALCVIAGFKKGFFKIAVITVGYIVSFAVSWTLSFPVSNKLYDNFLKEKNKQVLSEIVPNNNYSQKLIEKLNENGIDITDQQLSVLLNDDSAGNLYNYLSESGYDIGSENDFNSLLASCTGTVLNQSFTNNTIFYSNSVSNEFLNSDPQKMTQIIKDIISKDPDESVNTIESVYLRKIETIIIRMIFTMIFTSVMMIFINIISKKVLISDDRVKTKAANSFFGGVIGIVDGLFYLYIVSVIVHILVTIGEDQMVFFNDAVIEKTKLFQYFYRVMLHM